MYQSPYPVAGSDAVNDSLNHGYHPRQAHPEQTLMDLAHTASLARLEERRQPSGNLNHVPAQAAYTKRYSYDSGYASPSVSLPPLAQWAPQGANFDSSRPCLPSPFPVSPELAVLRHLQSTVQTLEKHMIDMKGSLEVTNPDTNAHAACSSSGALTRGMKSISNQLQDLQGVSEGLERCILADLREEGRYMREQQSRQSAKMAQILENMATQSKDDHKEVLAALTRQREETQADMNDLSTVTSSVASNIGDMARNVISKTGETESCSSHLIQQQINHHESTLMSKIRLVVNQELSAKSLNAEPPLIHDDMVVFIDTANHLLSEVNYMRHEAAGLLQDLKCYGLRGSGQEVMPWTSEQLQQKSQAGKHSDDLAQTSRAVDRNGLQFVDQGCQTDQILDALLTNTGSCQTQGEAEPTDSASALPEASSMSSTAISKEISPVNAQIFHGDLARSLQPLKDEIGKLTHACETWFQASASNTHNEDLPRSAVGMSSNVQPDTTRDDALQDETWSSAPRKPGFGDLIAALQRPETLSEEADDAVRDPMLDGTSDQVSIKLEHADSVRDAWSELEDNENVSTTYRSSEVHSLHHGLSYVGHDSPRTTSEIPMDMQDMTGINDQPSERYECFAETLTICADTDDGPTDDGPPDCVPFSSAIDKARLEEGRIARAIYLQEEKSRAQARRQAAHSGRMNEQSALAKARKPIVWEEWRFRESFVFGVMYSGQKTVFADPVVEVEDHGSPGGHAMSITAPDPDIVLPPEDQGVRETARVVTGVTEPQRRDRFKNGRKRKRMEAHTSRKIPASLGRAEPKQTAHKERSGAAMADSSNNVQNDQQGQQESIAGSSGVNVANRAINVGPGGKRKRKRAEKRARYKANRRTKPC